MKNLLLQIHYERKVEKFLIKNESKISKADASELIVKAIRKMTGKDENVDLVKMKGEFEGYFRIRKNDLRIIFTVIEEENRIVVKVVNIDYRGSAYK